MYQLNLVFQGQDGREHPFQIGGLSERPAEDYARELSGVLIDSKAFGANGQLYFVKLASAKTLYTVEEELFPVTE
ncbi:hypothetical protein ACFQ3L_04625 [Lacticaseibacillus jixianensis]|uniref:DUF2922 domain-containing protein n=1 Tax=Lacticaseibacillus jixianensis TaxID=2486012 RepID=A0ABW4B992_9LACO|nr:hypothetical protein [Lacticaseibacillus jixianensis]